MPRRGDRASENYGREGGQCTTCVVQDVESVLTATENHDRGDETGVSVIAVKVFCGRHRLGIFDVPRQ